MLSLTTALTHIYIYNVRRGKYNQPRLAHPVWTVMARSSSCFFTDAKSLTSMKSTVEVFGDEASICRLSLYQRQIIILGAFRSNTLILCVPTAHTLGTGRRCANSSVAPERVEFDKHPVTFKSVRENYWYKYDVNEKAQQDSGAAIERCSTMPQPVQSGFPLVGVIINVITSAC